MEFPLRFLWLILCFCDIYNKTRTLVISKLTSENELRSNCPSKTNAASKLARLAKLWISFWKSLVLHGVIWNGDIISEEPARTRALGSAWQPIFQAKDCDNKFAGEFPTSLGDFGEYSPNLQGPDYFSFHYSLQHRPNSTPGIDLVPFAGWQATGDLGISCTQ